jgi:hypothetical protein
MVAKSQIGNPGEPEIDKTQFVPEPRTKLAGLMQRNQELAA